MLSLLIALASLNPGITKIAVVDTGLDLQDPRFTSHLCPRGHADFTGEGIEDTAGHGTAVTGLIQQYAGKGAYCFVIVKYYSDYVSGPVNFQRSQEALRYVSKLHVKYVNYSSGGPGYKEGEYFILSHMHDTKIVTCAGNDGQDLDLIDNKYYPASYNLRNVIAVGCIDAQGARCKSSNYGTVVKAVELGQDVPVLLPLQRCEYDQTADSCTGVSTGTSFSTAIHTGKLIRNRDNNAK